MDLKLIAFGIAKDILNGNSLMVNIKDGSSIADLKIHLANHFPEFVKLAHLDFAIREEYVTDDTLLVSGDEVVVIPPVSGG